VELDESQGGALYDTNREDLKVKVYSGLHVNEAGPSEDDLEDNSLELVMISEMYVKYFQS